MEEQRRIFKYMIGERLFSFECDAVSNIWEAKDALCHFIANIIDIERKVIEEMAKKESTEVPVESVKE